MNTKLISMLAIVPAFALVACEPAPVEDEEVTVGSKESEGTDTEVQ